MEVKTSDAATTCEDETNNQLNLPEIVLQTLLTHETIINGTHRK
jgi:hypothetical protein